MELMKAGHLVKRYTDGGAVVTALDHASIDICKGEFIAVTGRSGSGKSTLFHQLGLIDTPTSGTLEILGMNMLALTESRKTDFRLAHIGYIFQDYALIPTLTAIENAALPLLMAGMSRVSAYAQAAKTLRDIGLAGREKHLPSQLSGGQQQRVSIARAVAHAPDIILADEPTANLDNESSLSVMGIFRTLASRGIAVVMITHESEYAAMADRIITLSDGRIVDDRKN